MFSVTIALPSATAISATAIGMKSVAKPGCGSVATSTARNRPGLCAHSPSGVGETRMPISHSFIDDDLEVLEPRADELDLAAGDAARHEQRAGFDAVGHDLAVGRRRARRRLRSRSSTCPAPIDLRAHAVEERGEVGDLGLARRVLDDGRALGEHRRAHQVLGRADARELEHDARAGEPVARARARSRARPRPRRPSPRGRAGACRPCGCRCCRRRAARRAPRRSGRAADRAR